MQLPFTSYTRKIKICPEITFSVQIEKKNRLHTLKFGSKPTVLKASSSSVDIPKIQAPTKKKKMLSTLLLFPAFSSTYECQTVNEKTLNESTLSQQCH